MKTLVPLILSLTLLTACGARTSDSVTLDGSTSMERVLGALIEGYRDISPAVTVNYSGTGSGAGIEAVLSGVCDIGLSSRALRESEIEKGAVAHLIALDAIAVVVHPSNPISDLSREEIAAIFTGEVTNWAQLGGRNIPIAVYGREAGSGTRTAFEETLGISGRGHYTNEYSAGGDIAGNIAANPNGIGYLSLASVSSSVKLLRVEDVPCTEKTVRSGAYPLQRPFLMVTSANTSLSPVAQQFLEYAVSDAVAEYLALAGAVAP